MRLFTKAFSVALVLLSISLVSVFAKDGSSPEITDGFVCPVLGGQAGGDHGNSSPEPIVPIAGEDSTVVGPNVRVPVRATNDNGAGTPGGEHTSPGDRTYTAVWAAQ